MNHDEAIQLALGYSWASEDTTGTKTASPADAPGTMAFADAFAQGWDDYSAEWRCFMIPVKDAYGRWQETKGETIFNTLCGNCGRSETHANPIRTRVIDWRIDYLCGECVQSYDWSDWTFDGVATYRHK
jgi:hypothetical protein